MEGSLVNVYDVDFGLMLKQVCDFLGELLLLMLELHFPCGFGAVNDLGLAEGRPMFEVVLPNGPS